MGVQDGVQTRWRDGGNCILKLGEIAPRLPKPHPTVILLNLM